MHCFTGTEEEARRILDFPGFLLGINGVVTFKKSSLPAVLKHLPLERMVLETDAPYLAPVPHRGKRNESAFVGDTMRKLAEIMGEAPEKVAQVTTENALAFFGMKERDDIFKIYLPFTVAGFDLLINETKLFRFSTSLASSNDTLPIIV